MVIMPVNMHVRRDVRLSFKVDEDGGGFCIKRLERDGGVALTKRAY